MLEENAKVGKKYIVVIPSKIRKKIGIKEEDILRVRLEDFLLASFAVSDFASHIGVESIKNN